MPLHSYQQHFIDIMQNKARFAFLLPQGAGKTLVMLEGFRKLKENNKARRALVLAPVHVMHNAWVAEIEKWGFNFSYHIAHGKGLVNIPAGKDIYIASTDIVRSQKIKQLLSIATPDIFVIDESSKFRNSASQRFKCLAKLSFKMDRKSNKMTPRFSRMYLLTGTPAPRHLENLWSQIFLLDAGQSLGRYISHFRQRYFYPTGGYRKWRLKYNAETGIYSACSKYAQSIILKHTQTPIVNDVYIDMPPEALRLYRKLEKTYILEMQSGDELVAFSAGAKRAKLRQLSGGAAYTDEKDLHHHFTNKVDRLLELVEEQQGTPILIGYTFTHEMMRITERLEKKSIRYSVIRGGMPTAKVTSIIEQWNRKELEVLIGHPASMAHGLNLQEGGYSIAWFSPPDDLELYLQFNTRLDRQGQKNRVIIYHFITRSTQDAVVYRALARKENVQKALLAYLEQFEGGLNGHK